MTRPELLKEIDRIIESCVADGWHDTEILKEARDQLRESDLNAFKRILSNCKNLNGKWDVHTSETEEMEFIYDLTIRDFNESVTLCFDDYGRLYA